MADERTSGIELVRGEIRAVIATTGAALRSFSVGAHDVLWGTSPAEIVGDGRGQVLAPWPNRLQDGVYRFEEHEAQVPWNEPARRNAIHGLVRWLTWSVESSAASSVRLACPLAPQPAYPFLLDLAIVYQLVDEGLVVSVEAGNSGHIPLPFGIGFHPYFSPGVDGLDAAGLSVPAARHLLTDERGLPIGEESLDRPPSWAPLGDVVLDDCYGGLAAGPDGRWRVRIVPRAGRSVAVFGDEAFRYVMCFTADTLAPPMRRSGLAIEPMTCPPNALRSGTDLIVLEPGERFVAEWGIEV